MDVGDRNVVVSALEFRSGVTQGHTASTVINITGFVWKFNEFESFQYIWTLSTIICGPRIDINSV